MKCSNYRALVLFLSIQIIISIHITPKANNLSSHWGTRPKQNKYGPPAPTGVDIVRQGEGEIKPIENFDSEIKPKEVTSGDLGNTAYDASKIISPKIAPQKAEITTHYHHVANVKIPTLIGEKISEEKEQIQKANEYLGAAEIKNEPIVSVLSTQKEVDSTSKKIIDLETGKKIEEE